MRSTFNIGSKNKEKGLKELEEAPSIRNFHEFAVWVQDLLQHVSK
jgi:hypothetical protein